MTIAILKIKPDYPTKVPLRERLSATIASGERGKEGKGEREKMGKGGKMGKRVGSVFYHCRQVVEAVHSDRLACSSVLRKGTKLTIALSLEPD